MEKITFQPNIIETVALKFPDGKQVEGRFGDQIYYSLTDGRAMYLDLDVAKKINALEIRAREAFAICKRWTGKKGDPMQWDVWRPDASQALPPAPPPAAPAVQPGASVSAPAPAAAPPIVTKAEPPATNGNGNGSTVAKTNGNGNGQRVYVPDYSHTPPTKIPMDEAFREVLRWVTQELQASHEQWTDESKQGLISTILIQAARDGYTCCWKREVTQ